MPFAALGQTTTDPAVQQKINLATVNQVFGQLTGRPDLSFRIDGTQRIGNQVSTISTEVVWYSRGVDTNRTIKFALRQLTNGALVSEIRANGDTLFAYDYLRRSYSATRYDEVNTSTSIPTRVKDYESRFFSTLGRVVSASGTDAYAVRVITDAMSNVEAGVAVARFQNWMLFKGIEELSMPQTYPDYVLPPAVRAPYVPTLTDRYLRYGPDARQSLVFNLDQPTDTDSPPTLRRVLYGDATRLGNRVRFTEWTLWFPPVDVSKPVDENQFKPYTDMRGWRPSISPGARRVGAGG